MNTFSASVRKLALEPGILFPIANVFVFAQSHSLPAFILASCNVAVCSFAVLHRRVSLSPLRITAWFISLSALLSLLSGGTLPGLAGLMFSTGHFIISSGVRRSTDTKSALMKAVSHPAIYYGLGSAVIGIMAGGGIDFLAHPLNTPVALIMVACGITTILTASFGLAFDLLHYSTPFWVLAAGGGINCLAGFWVANYLGALSCVFSIFGNLRLGRIHARTQPTSL